MKSRLKFLVIIAISLVACLCIFNVKTALTTTLTISGRQILVDGAPFTIKGVGYAPVPICIDPTTTPPYGNYFTSDYSYIYNRDLPLLRQMGANTCRLWGWNNQSDHTDFLDKAYNDGVNPIYVIVTFWMEPWYYDITDPDVREAVKCAFRQMVAAHKNHPAVLMWSIGNELNAPWMYGNQLNILFNLIDEMAQEAHEEEGQNAHPVTTPLADIDLINTIATYNSLMAHLDVWSVQIYRGSSFGSLFTDYAVVSERPLAILEYGIDAYDNRYADEYENIGTPYQATYAEALWNEIEANSDVCCGGSIMAYSDEWWKGKYGQSGPGCPDYDPCFHSICGYPTASHPDGFSNEEWWGIMRTLDNGSNPDIMQPRTVYYILQSLWTHIIYEYAYTTLDHIWTSISLNDTYQNPVVIVGPPTYHGTDPGVVRLQNVTNNSFDIRFQEWLYKDGAHTQENIPYMVLSPGRHQMANGSIWEAGTFSLSGTGAWTSQSFTSALPSTPALFLTAQTYNGPDPITVRARNITNTGFESALFEEEDKMDGHTTEEVGYLAVYSPQLSGTVNINGTDVPYLLQAQSVDHRFVPVLSSDIKLEEEQSKDTEINHINETISILALGDKIFAQDISSNGYDTVAIRRLAPEYGAAMEWGTVDGVDHNWMKVPLAKEYMNPVVVAKPVSSRGGDPGVIRIRNVSYNSFELRYNEWAYKDGWHIQERVFYMVAEAGERSVAGLTIEAGRLNTSKLLADGWEPITFSASFGQTPSVFTSVQTCNGGDPVTTRVRDCTLAGFKLTMDEEEAKNDGHITETLGWIAIEKGTGNTNDNRSVVVLSDSTNHIPTQISFGQSMARRFPVVVSDMITTYGSDPGFLRYQNLGPNSIDLFIQEEQSADTEMNHTMEDVSLFVAE
jgi:hypothetical protein